jgi:uncharacterized protein (TIRG00374 family)
MNRKRLLSVLPWLLGAALLILSIGAVSLEEVIATLRALRPAQIVVLIVANVFVLATITGRWWLLLRGVNHRLPLRSLFTYRLAAFGLSYFTPGPHVGGELLQVLSVEKDHGVPRADALTAVALDKAIEFSVNLTFLLLGVAATLRWRIVPQEAGQQALGLAAALLLLPLSYLGATALGFYPGTHLTQPLARRWSRWVSAADTVAESEVRIGLYFRRAPGAFLAAVGVTLVGWAAMIAEYWLMVRFLGVDLTLPQLVTTLTAARISILLFLPAGLGVLEASQATAFALLGLDPAIGVSVGLLIRLRDTLLGLIGLWWWGGRRLVPTRWRVWQR